MTFTRNLSSGPPACRTCPVHACTLYGCDERERDEIGVLRREFRFVPARSVVLREGAEPATYLTLQAGWAFRYRPMPEGGRAVLHFILPGDPIFLPLLWGSRPTCSVRSLTDLALCVFNSAETAGLVQTRATIFANLGRYIARETGANDDRNAGCGRLSARERVVRLLLDLYDRLTRRGLSRDQAIDFPLRQHHIADALGLTPVHISRVMTELRREGLIEIEAQRLTVIDLPAMQDIAGHRGPTASAGGFGEDG